MNLSENTRRILCYGDSNTWSQLAYSPWTKLKKLERWTGILQSKLGENFEIIEDGLRSRTAGNLNSDQIHLDGLTYFDATLSVHDPLDVVITTLSTCDLFESFKRTHNMITNDLIMYQPKSRNSQNFI